MWPTSVKIGGVAVGLDVVLADAVIRQGRVAVDDAPVASSAQLRLENITRAYSRSFMVGVSLELAADGAPRFTGTITDAQLDDDVLTVIGVGVLASLSRYTVGAADWPAEAWSSRVLRVFAEAGLSTLLVLEYDPGFDPLLVARPGSEVKLSDYLKLLSDDVGAAIADTPDGHVLVQALSSRQPATTLAWKQMPRSTVWSSAACTWAQATSLHAVNPSLPASGSTIDPADVLYVPAWEQTLQVENVTDVTLGDGVTVVSASDASSSGLFGAYPGAITTELSLAADGLTRASQRVKRRAYPRWSIPGLTLLRGYPLAVGRQVLVADFPPSSPFATWNPVVEGWTDTIRGDAWTCDVAVSDPMLSGLVLVWTAVPRSLAWAGVDRSCRWVDALELGDLIPSAIREELVHA